MGEGGRLQALSVRAFWTWLGLSFLIFVLEVFEVEGTGLVVLLGNLAFLLIFAPLIYNWFRGRSEQDDRALFAEELADLLENQVPLVEALTMLAQDKASRFDFRLGATTPVLLEVAEQVKQGQALSAAVGEQSLFPPAWKLLLAPAEKTEAVVPALRQLRYLESSGIQLPPLTWIRIFFIVPLTVAIWGFLGAYIFPTFIELYKGMSLELSGLMMFMYNLQKLVGGPLMMVISVMALVLAMSLPFVAVRSRLRRVVMTLPAWRALRLSEQARICRVLAGGSRLELPLPELLELGAATAEHSSYQRAFRDMLKTEGSELAELLERHSALFEPALIWLAAQGERLNTLPEALEAASDFLREEAERVGQQAVVKLDTFILAMLGLVVLGVVLGTMGPIADLTFSLSEVYLP